MTQSHSQHSGRKHNYRSDVVAGRKKKKEYDHYMFPSLTSSSNAFTIKNVMFSHVFSGLQRPRMVHYRSGLSNRNPLWSHGKHDDLSGFYQAEDDGRVQSVADCIGFDGYLVFAL